MAVDWSDVNGEVRTWIENTKPPENWPFWIRIVKKKSADHWISVIAKDLAYQQTIKKPAAVPPPPPPPNPEPDNNPEEPPANVRARKRKNAPPPDKKDSKRKQKEALALAKKASLHEESKTAGKARRVAFSRTIIHGRVAAEEAGNLASAKVTNEETIEKRGDDFIRPQKRNEFHQLLEASMIKSRVGMKEFRPNKLNLTESMDVDDILAAIKKAREDNAVARDVDVASNSSSTTTTNEARMEMIRRLLPAK